MRSYSEQRADIAQSRDARRQRVAVAVDEAVERGDQARGLFVVKVQVHYVWFLAGCPAGRARDRSRLAGALLWLRRGSLRCPLALLALVQGAHLPHLIGW